MQDEGNPQSSGLCMVFHHLASRTWDRMRNNLNTPILMREDGITAANLQDLHYYQSHAFTFVDFTPRKAKGSQRGHHAKGSGLSFCV